jgi:hypothetical protein
VDLVDLQLDLLDKEVRFNVSGIGEAGSGSEKRGEEKFSESDGLCGTVKCMICCFFFGLSIGNESLEAILGCSGNNIFKCDGGLKGKVIDVFGVNGVWVVCGDTEVECGVCFCGVELFEQLGCGDLLEFSISRT